MQSKGSSLLDFVSAYAGWFAIVSLASFLVGLLLMPVFIARIPSDYFSRPRRTQRPVNSRQLLLQLMTTSVKNVFGFTLVLAGLLMLFIPGQGLITLLVGLMIMDYPGKRSLERWLIERPRVLTAVNWLRAKYDSPPLNPPKR